MKANALATAWFVDERHAAPDLLELPCGRVVVHSSRCPGKESPNEDAAAVIPVADDTVVLVVADGMGGGPAGEKAALLAVHALAGALEEIDPSHDQQRRFAILNGIEEANRSIQQLGIGAATTLAVVEICGRVMRPYHVGDCLILVVGQRGKLKLQAVPHSPVGYGVESGLLDDNEAMHHADRHLVSNVVGSPDMRIEVGAPLELAARDTLIVASDGLSDNLRVDEIASEMRKGNLWQAAERLALGARERMSGAIPDVPSKPDDLTLLAFRPRRAFFQRPPVKAPAERVAAPTVEPRRPGPERGESTADTATTSAAG
ncbi:MAG: protein phosphatase 2C domain-containing protein [Pirellulaceae bacterium]|nr:protein phosphatase 2C domain-containing protein [Pirellulaceae bacterium]